MKICGVTTLLQVFDMPSSVAFYRDVLGFTLVSTSDPGDHFYWAMLKLGEATLMLNTAYEDEERPPSADPARVAAHADTILYFGCDSVDDVYAHLRANDWETQERVIQTPLSWVAKRQKARRQHANPVSCPTYTVDGLPCRFAVTPQHLRQLRNAQPIQAHARLGGLF